MKKIQIFTKIILAISLYSQAFVFAAQTNVDSTYLRIDRYGPFILMKSSGDSVRIFVEVTHIHYSAALKYVRQETDCSYTFVDSKDNVLYRVNDRPDYNEESTSIRPAQLTVPRVGPLILLMSENSPSEPGDGILGQLFGFNEFNYLVPFTTDMRPSSNSMEASTFRPVLIQAQDISTQSDYSTDDSALPAIETDSWTGNFTVYDLYPVWSSRTSPSHFYQTKYHVKIDTAEVSRVRKHIKNLIL